MEKSIDQRIKELEDLAKRLPGNPWDMIQRVDRVRDYYIESFQDRIKDLEGQVNGALLGPIVCIEQSIEPVLGDNVFSADSQVFRVKKTYTIGGLLSKLKRRTMNYVWVCPKCGAEYDPESPYDEFSCLDCGKMGEVLCRREYEEMVSTDDMEEREGWPL